MPKRFKYLPQALIIIAILILSATAVVAQTTGSIRGVVYRDVDADGICAGTGAQGVPGISLELANQDDGSAVFLDTGNDGSFNAAGINVGTYQVTVRPGDGWRVTGQQTRQAVITAEQSDATGIDFCIVEVGATTLPESGFPVSPTLIAAVVAALLLLVGGAMLVLRSRQIN